ncbi:hypothetical protein IQ266_00625 [filamentous cyanobacterium LEGE 11480]|uniref:Uncharacterized protein n=1 Tax=Romeriopsis navalis LEGE 11480 TaxID=2777977 RepID=A0A928VGP1_9CYAN|nr:hypothetical protein [Romeriopsis navalis]MBE9028258.1 hypothetical protein [Romeriopsis navalis LEGE 11480]
MNHLHCPVPKTHPTNTSRPETQHPPLRGELADMLSQYCPVESLRGMRLLVVDAQLKTLLSNANDAVPQMKALIEHLGAAIELAEAIDWDKSQPKAIPKSPLSVV